MTGGIIQLVSIGLEDLYLSINPEITYFKMIYKRYTNFSVEPIIQYFNNTPDFGRRITANLSKNSDLISSLYLYVKIPSISKRINKFEKIKWSRNIGFDIIKYIELEINGQLIDKLYSDWLYIWSVLTTQQNISENKLVGNINHIYNYSYEKNSYNLYIPINFFFNKFKGISLPIISLQSSDIKIHIEFNDLDKVLQISSSNYVNIEENIVHFEENEILYQKINNYENKIIFNYFDYENKRLYYTKYIDEIKTYNDSQSIKKSDYKIYNKYGFYVMPNSDEKINKLIYNNLSIINSYLIINYIFLSNLEREKFIKSEHEYLITNLQFSGDKYIYNKFTKIKLPFTNLSKEIFWIGQMEKIKNGYIKESFNYTDDINYSGNNIINNTIIYFNGQKRSLYADKFLYNYLYSYFNHNSSIKEGINLYSFSLNPQDNQPMGSCNFSKIDDLVMEFNLTNNISYKNPVILKIFSLNYNIFKIKNGLGGLQF